MVRKARWQGALMVLMALGCTEPGGTPAGQRDLAMGEAEMGGAVVDMSGRDMQGAGRDMQEEEPGPPVDPICTPLPNRWCWENPLPQGNELLGLFAVTPVDIWAVGRTGTILHGDGKTWWAEESGTEESLFGVWGSAPNDVWAVGAGGTILRWDGMKWNKVPGGGTTWFKTIWGTGPNEIWIGGASETVLRWDESKLVEMPTRNGNYIEKVWASGPSDVWAVTSYPGKVLRWDGMEWKVLPGFPLATEFVRTIWGSAANNVWLMAGAPVRWDGMGFRTSMTGGTPVPQSAVWGSAAGDVWAAGGQILARFDGFVWKPQAAPPRLNKVEGEWISTVGGTGSGDIWIATYRPHHWDGMAWNSPGGGSMADIRGGWTMGASQAWVVGARSAPSRGVVAKYKNGTWDIIYDAKENLYGIWASSPNDIWAVGDKGYIIHWNGTVWMEVASGVNEQLYGIYGFSNNEIFSIGNKGTMLKWNGTSWSRVSVGIGISEPFLGIWAETKNNIWIVGGGGTILHFSGTSWSIVPSGTKNIIRKIFGISANSIWAVGDKGTVIYWDGISWKMIPGIEEQNIVGIYGNNGRDIWAVGGVSMLHWNGMNWSKFPRIISNPTGLFGGYGQIWAIGLSGSILRAQ